MAPFEAIQETAMNKISRRAFVTSASALGLVGASGLALPY